MTHDEDCEEDRCVPLFSTNSSWKNRNRRNALLDELIGGLYDDMCTYADMQMQAEACGEIDKEAEYKQKFGEARLCMNLLSDRADALLKHNKGENYVGAPTWDAALLDDWMHPTVDSLHREARKKMKEHAVAAASTHLPSEKEAARAAWNDQRTLMAFLESCGGSKTDQVAEKLREMDRREEMDLMPDSHEYA